MITAHCDGCCCCCCFQPLMKSFHHRECTFQPAYRNVNSLSKWMWNQNHASYQFGKTISSFEMSKTHLCNQMHCECWNSVCVFFLNFILLYVDGQQWNQLNFRVGKGFVVSGQPPQTIVLRRKLARCSCKNLCNVVTKPANLRQRKPNKIFTVWLNVHEWHK